MKTLFRSDLDQVCDQEKDARVLVERLLSRTESQTVGQSKTNEKMDQQLVCIDDKVNRILGELERVQEKMYDFEGRIQNCNI